MAIHTTYSNARAHLAELLDKVTNDRERVVITRRGAPNVVLVAEDALAGLEETAYLLRSPANAERLIAAIERLERGEGTVMTTDDLDREYGAVEQRRRDGIGQKA